MVAPLARASDPRSGHNGADARREFAEVIQPLVERLVQTGQVQLQVAVNQDVTKAGDRAKAVGESRIENAHRHERIDGRGVVSQVVAGACREVGRDVDAILRADLQFALDGLTFV